MRLLLVEDDPILGDGIRAGLKQRKFVVDWVKSAEDGEDALSAAEGMSGSTYACLVLDVGLPGMSGLELLKRLRNQGFASPVLILTARDAVTDRVRGLDSGADDYVVKPFSMDELAARIRALVRRSQGRSTVEITHVALERGALELDPISHRVTLDGKAIELSPREFAILRELLESRGRVLSREQLEEQLYGWNEEVESNAVEVHIHHLRRKLGAELIRTIRGVGYMIEKSG